MPFGKKSEEVSPEKPFTEVEGAVAITPNIKALAEHLKLIGSNEKAEDIVKVYTEETRPKPEVKTEATQLSLPIEKAKTKE